MSCNELNELYSGDDEMWSSFTSKRFRLPYDVISSHKKVVLYGAGKIGDNVYKVATEDELWRIVLWVDKEYEKKDNRVSCPLDIRNVEYDYVYVAIKKEKYQKQVLEELVSIGVDKEKIVFF